MNDRDDELASAWLDGELDDADLRAVAGDDPVRRARRELAVAQAALAAPVPAPEGLADAQIAAALDLLAPSAERQGRVVTLPVRPARNRSWLLARAAAAVLVVGGLGLGVAAVVDDPAAQDDAALTATSAGEMQRAADTAGGAQRQESEADEGAARPGPSGETAAEAAPGPLSRAASELAASPLDATGLLAALERTHGPVATWPDEPLPPDSCTPTLSPADGDGPVAAVAFERAGVPLELIVPADGDAYLLERGTCERVR